MVGLGLTQPPPVVLAHELAPLLEGLTWGIGGSVLMWNLGLEPAPRDLDVVTTPDDFDAIRERVARRLGPPAEVPHSMYQSRCFARFAADGPASMDLMAGIQVKTARGLVSWAFDQTTLSVKDGLPWMRPEDWIELYELFDRPQRAMALRDHLRARSNRSD